MEETENKSISQAPANKMMHVAPEAKGEPTGYFYPDHKIYILAYTQEEADQELAKKLADATITV